MKVSENIMNAHVKAGMIQDPHFYPEAALKVLRGHFEVMEHAARFIELSEDDNAASEIMTGGNLIQILEMLPLRVRQDDDSLETAETNVSKRKDQYMKIKKWVAKMQQKLIVQGTKLDKKQKPQLPWSLLTNRIVKSHKTPAEDTSKGTKATGIVSKREEMGETRIIQMEDQ